MSPIPGGPHEFVPPEIGGYEFEEPSTLEQPAEAEQGEEAQAEETVPVENWSERYAYLFLVVLSVGPSTSLSVATPQICV